MMFHSTCIQLLLYSHTKILPEYFLLLYQVFGYHAGLLGGRCIGRRCRVLLEYPGALCGGSVCQGSNKSSLYYICVMYCLVISNVSIIYCLVQLQNLIY